MHRQFSDKDCAITALAHATGFSYTKVVNSFPAFRYMRSRRRTKREKADQIIGRRKRMRGDEFGGSRSLNLNANTYRYNEKYRSSRFPYFCGFGLGDSEYKKFLDEETVLHIQKLNCSLAVLRHVPFALLSLPSINVKISGHMVIWNQGRIWDPSPKKRYNYLKLRQAAGITCLALPDNEAEYDRLRKVLRTKLHGSEIITMLTYKVLELIKTEGQQVNPAEITTWWESGKMIPPEIEGLIMERLDPA